MIISVVLIITFFIHFNFCSFGLNLNLLDMVFKIMIVSIADFNKFYLLQ